MAGPAGPAASAVPHPRDLGLAEARALVQRAVDKAEQLRLRGAVAVVGASGTLITASRMDAGGPGGMARARSKAWISATQQIPSSGVARQPKPGDPVAFASRRRHREHLQQRYYVEVAAVGQIDVGDYSVARFRGP